jgi:hypothetical protein
LTGFFSTGSFYAEASFFAEATKDRTKDRLTGFTGFIVLEFLVLKGYDRAGGTGKVGMGINDDVRGD